MGNEIPTALQEQMDAMKAALAGNEETAQQEEAPLATPQAPGVEDAPDPSSQPQRTERMADGAQMLGNTAQAPGGDDSVWQQKYRVIKGKYDAETRRLREELEARKAELETLRVSGQAPKADGSLAPAEAVTRTDVSDDDVRRLVSTDLLDEYGTDYWKQQIQLVRAMQPQAPQADDRLQQVESRIAEQDRQAFYSDLAAKVPDWQKVNDSQAWNDFLGKVEPLTGATYEALLMDAYDRYDSGRVSELFRQFSRVAGGNAPSIESQVMPGTRPSPESAGAAGKAITFDEWTRQMDALTQGGLSPMQAIQKKNELMDAWKNGRVTGAPNGGPNGSPAVSASFV